MEQQRGISSIQPASSIRKDVKKRREMETEMEDMCAGDRFDGINFGVASDDRFGERLGKTLIFGFGYVGRHVDTSISNGFRVT